MLIVLTHVLESLSTLLAFINSVASQHLKHFAVFSSLWPLLSNHSERLFSENLIILIVMNSFLRLSLHLVRNMAVNMIRYRNSWLIRQVLRTVWTSCLFWVQSLSFQNLVLQFLRINLNFLNFYILLLRRSLLLKDRNPSLLHESWISRICRRTYTRIYACLYILSKIYFHVERFVENLILWVRFNIPSWNVIRVTKNWWVLNWC